MTWVCCTDKGLFKIKRSISTGNNAYNSWLPLKDIWLSLAYDLSGNLFISFRMYILNVMVLLHCLVCGNASSALNKMWQEWQTKHGKSYDNQVGLWTTLGIHLPATDQPVSRSLSDGDSLPASGVGEEPALCGPTQPGGLSWKTQLHHGTQPSVRPGEDNNSKQWLKKIRFDPFVMSQRTHIPLPSRFASTQPIWSLVYKWKSHRFLTNAESIPKPEL